MVIGKKLVNVVDEDVIVEGIDVTIVVITNEEAESPVLVADLEEERDVPEDIPVVAAPELELGIGELALEVKDCESERELVNECEEEVSL